MGQSALQEIKLNTDDLTGEQRERVRQLKEEIELTKMLAVIQYGVPVQEKMASFSERAMRSIGKADLVSAAETLGEIMDLLKDFEWEEKKGMFGRTKQAALPMAKLQDKYIRVEKNIADLKEGLVSQRIQLLQTMNILDDLAEMNQAQIRELEIYLYAGKLRVREEREGRLLDLERKAKESGEYSDVQAFQELEASCDAFERKLLDLNITRTAALQLAQQINLLLKSQSVMASKIHSTITNVIPIWNSRMVVLLGLESLNQAMGTQAMISRYTDEMLKQTSERIKSSAKDAAKQTEKAAVDLETLKQTNEDLVTSFADVLKIQKEGKDRRQEIERELTVLHSAIKSKLNQ